MAAKNKTRNKPAPSKKKLTSYTDDKLRLFAENYRACGGNKTRAYQLTFDTSELKKGSINSLAYRLMRENSETGTKIRAFLEELNNSADNRLTHDNAIAKGDEVAAFFSKVMRGEETDAFGLDVGIDSRIKAAENLAKINQMYTQNINVTGVTQVQILDDMDDDD